MEEIKLILESVNGLAGHAMHGFIAYLAFKLLHTLFIVGGIALIVRAIFKGIRELCENSDSHVNSD